MKQFKPALLLILLTGTGIIFGVTGCKHGACKDLSCLNNGVCNSGTCNCPYYATGKLCDTLIRQQFVDSFSGTGTTTGAQGGPASVVVTAGPDSLSEITLLLHANVVGGDSFHAVVYPNGSIIIPSQTYNLDFGTAQGSGILTGTTMYDTINITAPLFTGIFYFSGTKQH